MGAKHDKLDQRSFTERWLPHPLMARCWCCCGCCCSTAFSFGGLVVGVVLAVVITRVTSNFWPERPPVKSWTKAFAYLGVVAWDVVVANLQVTRLILFRPVGSLATRWVVVLLSCARPRPSPCSPAPSR